MSVEHLTIITGMAAVTLATRLLGYWWAASRTLPDWLERLLGAIPGAVLASVIAPIVLTQGPTGWVAGTVAVIATRFVPTVLVIIAAVATAALMRQITG